MGSKMSLSCGCKVGVVNKTKDGILEVILDKQFEGHISTGQRLMIYNNEDVILPNLGRKNFEIVRGVGKVIKPIDKNTVLVKSARRRMLINPVIVNRQPAHKFKGVRVFGKNTNGLLKRNEWEFGIPKRGDLVKIL